MYSNKKSQNYKQTAPQIGEKCPKKYFVFGS